MTVVKNQFEDCQLNLTEDDNRQARRDFNMYRRALLDISDPFSLPNNLLLKVFRLNKELVSFC